MLEDEFTFDLDRWLREFPPGQSNEELIGSSHGPEELVELERVRRLAAALGDMGSTVPVDIFALAFGEPSRLAVTKFGGLPYRPRGRPWPVSSEDGRPLTFVGQFRFTESQDIVGPLPGDLLLAFFADFAGAPYDWFPGPPCFEWYPLGLIDLMTSRDVPRPSFVVPPCHGVRWRTVDFADEAAAALIRRVTIDPCDRYSGDIDTDRQKEMRTSHANRYRHAPFFKIGGVPYWDWEEPSEIEAKGVVPGRFLCSLAQIGGDAETRYPWVNCEHEVYFGLPLAWSSGAIVHLFVTENGKVVPRIQLYR